MNKTPFYIFEEALEKKLFEDSLIVFDTSAILDFYYFTKENIDEVESKLFPLIEKRLWLTHQSHFEFLKNKDKVKSKPIDSYNNLISKAKGNTDSAHIEEIENIIKQIQSNISSEIVGHLKTFQEKVSKNNKHPYLGSLNFSNVTKDIQNLEKATLNFKTKFEEFKQLTITEIEKQKEIFKVEKNDRVIPIVEQHFNLTNGFSYDQINELIKEGEFRYKNQIPPGYMDADDKIGFQKYGDLIVWKEIIELSNKEKKNIILVINDVKEDWWYLDDKKKHLSPRYELIKEFQDKTGSQFWMYDIGTFLYKANSYISTSIDMDTIEEIINITEERNFFENSFVNWIFTYLDLIVLASTDKSDDFFDYYGTMRRGPSDSENIFISLKRINSPIYTKIMIPIREFLNSDKTEKHRILILEYDVETLSSFETHFKQKKLRILLKSCTPSKRIIITARRENEYFPYWDSIDSSNLPSLT